MTIAEAVDWLTSYVETMDECDIEAVTLRDIIGLLKDNQLPAAERLEYYRRGERDAFRRTRQMFDILSHDVERRTDRS